LRLGGYIAATAIIAMGGTAIGAKAQDQSALRIYFADVEGGQATLFGGTIQYPSK
jgi:hypothetical protein